MGRVTSVKRMAVHDGPGLRTTLFLKGCPLHCAWCHNPENISSECQTAYLAQKCLHCGECTVVCDANIMQDGQHVFLRENCTACGKCESVCLGGALIPYGREISAQEAAGMLLEDRVYFATTGGITLSGGEPLLQPDFSRDILRIMKSEGIHTAVDTCGFAPREALDKVLPYTDLFLFDIKAAREDTHRRCTGQSNHVVWSNLFYILSRNKAVEIRIPVVPGMNDGEMDAIAQHLSFMTGITLVRLLPYHPFAASKYASLGMDYPAQTVTRPSTALMQDLVCVFQRYGLNAVNGGDLP